MLECTFIQNFVQYNKFEHELERTFDQRIFDYFWKQFSFRVHPVKPHKQTKMTKNNLNIFRDHKTFSYKI